MNQITIGTWAEIPTPYTTDILSKAGLDFSILDMEHGVAGFALAQNMVFAAHSGGKQLFIRVPAIEEAWVLRALDTGCDGIVFPGVSNKKDVENIIACVYFAPIGKRGFNPYISAGGYTGADSLYFEKENERIKLCVILEGTEALEHLEEIVQYEEIDIVYIGQYDLSVALGVPGKVSAPAVLEWMEKAAGAIVRAGKKAGCMVHGIEEAKGAIRQGFSFLVYKTDSGILFQCMKEFVQGVSQNEAE